MLQCDPGHLLHKHTSRPSPPMTYTPRIIGGFGHTRQFLEPSGGAFYKSGPPWQSLPGIGPADLGQLWLVAYTGSQPLGICQRDSCPHPLSVPLVPTSQTLLFTFTWYSMTACHSTLGPGNSPIERFMDINGRGLVGFVEHAWDVLCWGKWAHRDKILIFFVPF